MLRRRSRTVQKEQSKMMPDSAESTTPKSKNTSFFSVPRLFVGFSTKCLSDCDAVRSPTSPLDYRVLSNLGSSILGSPRSPSRPKCWDSGSNSRVGLGLLDSLSEESKPSGKEFAEKKSSILFAPQMRVNILSSKSQLGRLKDETESFGTAPRSLPKDYGLLSLRRKQSGARSSKVFDLDSRKSEMLRSSSADVGVSSLPATGFTVPHPKSNSEELQTDSKVNSVEEKPCFDYLEGPVPPVSVDSSHELVHILSASDIEQSEDYTCIISHGPNPKTTKIFGDCVLESHSIESPGSKSTNTSPFWILKPSEELPRSSSADFLNFCFACDKNLEGKDIYMYRGEKAFCSWECRDREILIEEEMERNAGESSDSAESSMFH